jgi:hypothetical protein
MLMTVLGVYGQEQELKDSLIKVRIRNQSAQAEYYKAQSKPKEKGLTLFSALASAVGPATGAIIALAGILLNSKRQSRLEEKKWKRAKEDEEIKNTRLAVAELNKKLTIAIQAMQWATWDSIHHPNDMKEETLNEYDKKMKEIWPEIACARIGVAAINMEMYNKIMPLIERVSDLDIMLDNASRKFKKDPEEGIKAIAACGEESQKFKEKFINSIAEILKLEFLHTR